MESNDKTVELKKIFFFLAGKDEHQSNLKQKTEDILYGLDHYGLKMDQKRKDDLKNALHNKTDNDGNIDFEDFKECFDLKKKDRQKKTKEIQNTANEIYFLIQELIGSKEIKDQKLSKQNIRQIFEIVFCLDEVNQNYINTDSNNKILMSKNNNRIDKSGMLNKSHISNNNQSQIYKSMQKNKQTPTPVDKDEEDFARNLKNEFSNGKKDLAQSLIDCIDLDGDGFISLSDFEFLIKCFFDNKDH